MLKNKIIVGDARAATLVLKRRKREAPAKQNFWKSGVHNMQ
jgi:hypothetical protein